MAACTQLHAAHFYRHWATLYTTRHGGINIHHVFPKHSFLQNFQKYFLKNFLGPLPLPLGLLPLIFEFPYSRYKSHIFPQLSTSILTSFFTVLPNGLTQTSYVLLTLHPGDAQPVGPTHTWPTTRPTTLLQSVELNLHRHPIHHHSTHFLASVQSPRWAISGPILLRLIQCGSGGSVFWEVIPDCENNIHIDMYVILNGYRGRTV